MISFDEQEFKSTLPVNYVLKEGKDQKDYLIVMFTGFGEQKYSNISTLDNIDCHKLFIADSYGPHGSYYIGRGMSFDFESSVAALIFYISRKLGVAQENIICGGFSKGGSAALYFSLKYNLGHGVAGAPQIHIGNYIKDSSPETANYLLGSGEEWEGNLKKSNGLILELLEEDSLVNLHIFTSEKDNHFQPHIMPFLEKTEAHEKKVNMTQMNELHSQGDLAKVFPDYFLKKLLNIMYGITLENLEISSLGNNVWKFNLDLGKKPPGVKSSIVFKSSSSNKDKKIHFEGEYQFDLNEFVQKKPEIFNIHLVLSYEHRELLSYQIKEVLLGKGLVYEGSSINYENGELNFKVNINQTNSLKFAFYIKRNGKVIEKVLYQNSNSIKYKVPTKGTYQISYFIKTDSEEMLIEQSDSVHINNI